MIASDVPGTTRDSIRIALERDGKRYTLIDTAGIRRRARVEDALEKFSVIKSLQSVDAAHVTVLMLDAREGVADQDATLIGHVLESGRALVIAVNKWDGLDKYQREQCNASLSRKLDFVPWARQVFISAKHGTGIGDLMKAVDRAHASANHKFTSSELTRALEAAYAAYQPPLVRGHAPKLRLRASGRRQSADDRHPRLAHQAHRRKLPALSREFLPQALSSSKARRSASSSARATIRTRASATS